MVSAATAAGAATVTLIDDSHANAYTAWQSLGKPQFPDGLMDSCTLTKLHASSKLVELPAQVSANADQEQASQVLLVVVAMAPTSVARVRMPLP